MPFLLTRLVIMNLVSQRIALARENLVLFSARYAIDWDICAPLPPEAAVLRAEEVVEIGSCSVVKACSICEVLWGVVGPGFTFAVVPGGG